MISQAIELPLQLVFPTSTDQHVFVLHPQWLSITPCFFQGAPGPAPHAQAPLASIAHPLDLSSRANSFGRAPRRGRGLPCQPSSGFSPNTPRSSSAFAAQRTCSCRAPWLTPKEDIKPPTCRGTSSEPGFEHLSKQPSPELDHLREQIEVIYSYISRSCNVYKNHIA